VGEQGASSMVTRVRIACDGSEPSLLAEPAGESHSTTMTSDVGDHAQSMDHMGADQNSLLVGPKNILCPVVCEGPRRRSSGGLPPRPSTRLEVNVEEGPFEQVQPTARGIVRLLSARRSVSSNTPRPSIRTGKSGENHQVVGQVLEILREAGAAGKWSEDDRAAAETFPLGSSQGSDPQRKDSSAPVGWAVEDVTMESQFQGVGDLPKLDAAYEFRRLAKWLLLAMIVALPGIIGGAQNGRRDCRVVLGVCDWIWAICIGTVIASLPLLLLFAKFIAVGLSGTRFLHINYIYFIVRLHEHVAYFLWSIFMYLFWTHVVPSMTADIDTSEGAMHGILACYLAYTTVFLVKNYCVLVVAHHTLWKPYLDRIRKSMFAQFVVLLLSDYVTSEK
jgi:hypothetical protein